MPRGFARSAPPIGALAGAALLVACYPGGDLEGLARTPAGDSGPLIRWDVHARPLPEIPFPNDVGTRTDLTSPTGKRINIFEDAPTAHERKLRGLINELDGFGTFAPLWVQFEDRIDLVHLHAIQTDDDPTNDGIYLLDVDPASPGFGSRAPIDLGPGPDDFGRTRFPRGLERPSNYFLNDPRAGASNLVLETVDEDLDGDGQLDPHEDTDSDGHLDRPNLWGEVLGSYDHLEPLLERLGPLYGGAPGFAEQRVRQYFDLLTFYELETESLLIQPVLPLSERTTYAVVLTRNIIGADGGSPIRSPFPWVHHLQQTGPLRPLVDDGILAQHGIGIEDVAFAWTFTTQSITTTVEAIRAGLYGEGTLARLSEHFPPDVFRVYQSEDVVPEDHPAGEPFNFHVLSSRRLLDALADPTVQSAVGLDPETFAPFADAYTQYVDYFVFFSVESPAFLENELGVFRVDPHSGDAQYTRDEVMLMCTVPRARGGRRPPFPVVFYGHGYTSSRFEMLGFGGSLARFGLATCGYDAYGHGLPNSDVIASLAQALFDQAQLGRVGQILFLGRDRDLNADGVTDSGGDFWSANTFHTRDVVRQSMIDQMQIIRVMRSFGTRPMPVDVDGDGQLELSGDFNGDGVPDMGAGRPYYVFGQSLGGIMSALVGAAEPEVRASAPGSGGAGLINLGLRSTQGGVVQAVFLPVFGPLIVGRASDAVPDTIDVLFDLLDVNQERTLRVARLPDPSAQAGGELALEVGDRVVARNLTNGEVDEVVIGPAAPGRPVGEFRLHLPADVGDRLRLEVYRGEGEDPIRVIDRFEGPAFTFQGRDYAPGDPLVLLQEGFGMRRQTPELRRLFSVAQMVVDPADPVNWAPLYARPVPMRPDGARPTNLLVVNTIGDMNVPIDTGINIARAAGLYDPFEVDPVYGKSIDDLLMDTWVIEGLEGLRRFAVDGCRHDTDEVLFDPDALSGGQDPDQGPNLEDVSLHPECAGPTPPPFCTGTCSAGPPLRVTRTYPWGVGGMRMPYLDRRGVHGFAMPDPTLPFDYHTFMIHQIGWYFASGGRDLRDDPCMADYEDPCPYFE